MTDYQNDLRKIERNIAEIGAPSDSHQATRRAYGLYQRAALTGRLDEFAAAEAAIAEAFNQIGPWPDLCLVKANLDMKFHRLAGAKRALEMAPGLAESFSGRVIWADIHLQEGRYMRAKQMCEALVAEDRTWDNLARLAYWEWKFGEVEDAERIYTEAEEEITAKEMRGYAWVQLQKGLLDLRRGRYEEAAAHYRRASDAYSGYWLIDEHLAELYGSQGKYDEAVATYERVLATIARPELQQAFGELYAAMGEKDEAEKWFDKALAGFLEASENGGVHYYHHLVDFFSDVREDGSEAVAWACRDFELRRNFGTEGALAWALYRNGQIAEADAMMDCALGSGVRDGHLFAKAAAIKAAAGHSQESQELSRRAFAMNPHHEGFHVHRS
ncbi:MAG TPA: tetratricopeptide repeat protein [Bryobacteraceae bacterium]|nr:tetratricopeptide repeat protein [Bryobacteraceae bacterium]HXR77053.1 tetratricopeptide repeat protein [Bryobacteraceae bacterium]